MVNALLVYPRNPITFWSFDETIKIAGKKVVFQPAGLLTVASIMPEKYDVKLIDENVEELKDSHLKWADVVLTSSMIIHWNSLENIIKRANELEKPVLAGGPLSTQYHNEINGNATFFLGESESGFVDALEDIVKGGYKEEKKVIDRKKQFLPLEHTPSQRFELIKDNLKSYAAMAIQTTRGCPESCTFCNIPALYGKKTRLKKSEQVLEEMDKLYELGWRNPIMIVDDNIVGNQEKIIPILNDIAKWQKSNGYPYQLFTQASLRMYDNKELMEAMYNAGFNQVFFGLESPSEESLKFMGAQKNLQEKESGKSMVEKIKDIQANYFKAQAGFILGFDSDPDNIAELMKSFIQDANIGVAMVGPLGVLPDTPDYERYKRQGRLVEDFKYDGGSGIFERKLSYVPMKGGKEIDPNIVLDRHKEVLEYINSPKAYFERNLDYFVNRKRKHIANMEINGNRLASLARSVYHQGIRGDYKKEYWKFLYNVVRNDMTDFPEAIVAAAEGHHLINTTNHALTADDINLTFESLERKLGRIEEWGHQIKERSRQHIEDMVGKYNGIKDEFKKRVKPAYRSFIERSYA